MKTNEEEEKWLFWGHLTFLTKFLCHAFPKHQTSSRFRLCCVLKLFTQGLYQDDVCMQTILLPGVDKMKHQCLLVIKYGGVTIFDHLIREVEQRRDHL